MIYALSFLGSGAAAFSGSQLVTDFNVWKGLHSKTYATANLEASALAAYSSNDAIIHEHNGRSLGYTLGHNQFSDMTVEEFSRTVLTELHLNQAPKNMMRAHITTEPLADSIDWVTKGAVTPVKNQGHCGSCWAFSAIGSIEGALATSSSNAKLVSLSEEQLVECDHHQQDNGCKGGLMDSAFTWVTSGNPLCTEADYPYSSGGGVTGTCVTSCSGEVKVAGHKDVPTKNEAALKAAVSQQPVSIAIEADKSAFQLYKSGVLDSTSCGTKLDHGVLTVGYGTDAGVGKDYWKVKNSWGTTWGEAGFIRMVRGKNMCGIASQASYPTGVTASGPSPPSPPGPSPPTPPAGKSHYGDPKDGCLSDEVEISIQGVTGDFCTPQCSFVKACPTDLPTGVTAKPQCALSDASSGKKYCALICSPSANILDQKAADAQCGTNASCKAIQSVGICTYDD